ncbi:MAG: hypothetical protein LUE64_00935, partial [Candidatus Gastranaerophilales bacterium]|nr:hypothetical protein [Candidatus Gastranaerophilales bacterium]
SNVFMITGFLLSLYTCVSNDVIQTLGTYLSANRQRPFWILWIFSGAVLILTFTLGWYFNDGDMSFGRLTRIPYAQTFYWWHVLPPLILILLTRKGIPVSTTFLILSVFSSSQVIGLMLAKSFFGYFVSFVAALFVYFIIARPVEKVFLYSKNKKISSGWHVAKWGATAFLWSQWLMQDAANLFVYLPRKLSFEQMLLAVFAFAMLLGIVCYRKGGEIQKILQLKTNTQDVRSATIIDIIYAFILMYFQHANNIPMSTTWVFIGLLAGREVAMYNRLRFETEKKVYKHVLKDLLKTVLGLIISIVTVLIINHFNEIKEIILHYINL